MALSRPDTIVALLAERARVKPDVTVFTFLNDGELDATSISYFELERRAGAAAARLLEHARPGDRALLMYPPGIEYLVGLFACFRAGVVAVPAYPPDPGRLGRSLPRLEAVADDCSAAVVLTTSAVRDFAAAAGAASPLTARRWLTTDDADGEPAALPRVGPDTIALLQYTSGSTRAPRGVILRHAHLLANGAMMDEATAETERGVFVGWLPPYHDMGLMGQLLQPMWIGMHSVTMSPWSFLQRPSRWLRAFGRYGGTSSAAPNFAYDLCVRKTTPEERASFDLRTWACAISGAEPVRRETIERFCEAFAPSGFRREAFNPCYGLAEATLIVTGRGRHEPPTFFDADARALSEGRLEPAGGEHGRARLVGCGRPLGRADVRVVDPDTCLPAPPGAVGEIWVASPSVADGYWGAAPDDDTFSGRLRPGGEGPFLRTGDLGAFAPDGELLVVGRRKDTLVVRGKKYQPHDVERAAEVAHPALRPGRAAAFQADGASGPDALVLAVEVVDADAPAADLAAAIAAARAAVADAFGVRPDHVALLKPGALFKTSSGKLQRFACKAAYLDGSLAIIATG